MFLSINTFKRKSGKIYRTVLLRESYRVGKKVCKRTVANLSQCSEEEIKALQVAFQNKKNLPIVPGTGEIEILQGRSIGGVYVLHELAKRLGIAKALGSSFHAKLGLWLIISRILEQGSRLSATRLDSQYDIASVIELGRGFDENNLYDCLHWLSENQNAIEDALFKHKSKPQKFYWYDVTSSYFEGKHNELAAYGYNRDQKKRKKIMVVGLLCEDQGYPISVEAFRGNTQDTQTIESQLIKLKERFGCQTLVMIGDRGMIRKKQKKLTGEHGFYYITALTMPEINSFLDTGILNLDDFSNELKSTLQEGIRYIYRRNPSRAKETQDQRKERLETAQNRVNHENTRLANKPKSSPQIAKKRTQKYLKRLCVDSWVSVKIADKRLYLEVNDENLKIRSRFDGCYVWTTDVPQSDADDRTIYDRYKDLKYIEDDFRSFKTSFLDVRPVFVRSEASTRGHLLVVMLAHIILRELRKSWSEIDKTVAEGLSELSLLCQNSIRRAKAKTVNYIPTPNEGMTKLLTAIGLKMPSSIDEVQVRVVTRRKVRQSASH